MRRTWRKLFVVAGPVLILGLQAVFTIILSTPSGIRMDRPLPDRSAPLTLPVTGTAWVRGGIERIEVIAQDPATGVTVTAPAERLAVKYRGVTAFLLSFWNAMVSFPSEGAWQVSARVIGTNGTSVTQHLAASPWHRMQSFESSKHGPSPTSLLSACYSRGSCFHSWYGARTTPG